jgi:hypothetical protein
MDLMGGSEADVRHWWLRVDLGTALVVPVFQMARRAQNNRLLFDASIGNGGTQIRSRNITPRAQAFWREIA